MHCACWNKLSKATAVRSKKIQLLAICCTDQKSILRNGLSKNKLTQQVTWTCSENFSSAVFNLLRYHITAT